jgi:hypothetical protein
MTGRACRVVLLVSLGCLLGLGGSSGQSLPGRVTDQCVRATVKITASFAGGSTFGSGSIIDPRGYVLTNFHVVGHIGPSRGTLGTLILPQNRYQLGTVDSSREAARPRWIGKVVRGDARLDLALVRIVSDEDGTLIRGAPFTTVSIARADELRPGSQVWAFGYPLGVRTINVTGGDVMGFEMNARGQVAWLRSDAEFNPGNSGGMLVDERGRIVAVPTSVVREGTLEPVELARPTERIPRDWLADLRRGHIDDLRIDGVPRLEPDLPYYDAAIGDSRGLGNREEFLYLLPSTRPASVRVSKRFPVVIANERGRILRRGVGEVEVEEGDPDGLIAAVVVPSEDDATDFDIRYEVVRRPAAPEVAAEEDDAVAEADAAAPRLEPPPPRPPAADAAPAPPAGATVLGRVRDPASGRSVEALVGIGGPGIDLRARLEALQAGRITAPEFDADLIANARTDIDGRFEVPGVPRGRTHPLIVARIGYRPALLDVRVGAGDALVDVGTIDLVAHR